MKLILTIVSDSDSEAVSQNLVSHGFRVTRVASTGGFFRKGSSTLLIGVADEEVDKAIESIRQAISPATTEADTQRAILFVLNVSHFTHI